MGTPDFAVPALMEIAGQGFTVSAVYTRAPRPAGRRGLALTPSPTHAAARCLGLPVETPRALRSEEAVATLRGYEPDVVVVAAFGLILPKAILDVPPLGCLNLHGSLLPRWRGAAPIQRAIMAGDQQTGVMVMRMEESLDTGPVALSEALPIGPNATAGELSAELATIGARLVVRALRLLDSGELTFTPQAEEGVTYAQKISKLEARIDWTGPATEIHDLVRGLNPSPGAFFEMELGGRIERVKVLRTETTGGSGRPGCVVDECLTIACGEGSVRLLEVQRSGGVPLSGAEFLRGARLAKGARLLSQKDAAL